MALLSYAYATNPLQYDPRSSTGFTTYNGNILQYNPLLLGLQYEQQDHRTHSKSLRNSSLRQIKRSRNSQTFAGNMRYGEGQDVPVFYVYDILTGRYQVQYNDDGLTALIFTSEGDMRQAINNLQSTYSGFGFVSGDNVFKVCDQPHPIIIQATIRACLKGDVDTAVEKLNDLWTQGYSAVDIVVTLFRVVKTFDE